MIDNQPDGGFPIYILDTGDILYTMEDKNHVEYWEATVHQIAGAVAADWQGTGSKDGAYFTLEKSAAILASFPS